MSKPTLAQMLEAARNAEESKQTSSNQTAQLEERYKLCLDNADKISDRIWSVFCLILNTDVQGNPKPDTKLEDLNLDEADKLIEGLSQFFGNYGVNIREPIPGFEEKTEPDSDKTQQVSVVAEKKQKSSNKPSRLSALKKRLAEIK